MKVISFIYERKVIKKILDLMISESG